VRFSRFIWLHAQAADKANAHLGTASIGIIARAHGGAKSISNEYVKTRDFMMGERRFTTVVLTQSRAQLVEWEKFDAARRSPFWPRSWIG
jgi:hypothetical protein